MKTYVEFRSDLFPAYPGEEEQINPGVWGRRLAEFLYEGFNRHGILASPPISEDWGWVVPIQNKPFSLWVGCGNYQEHPDGFLCFVEPSKPFVWRFFKRIPTEARIAEITKALDSMLSLNASIRDIRWWTEREFNNPRAEQAVSRGSRRKTPLRLKGGVGQ